MHGVSLPGLCPGCSASRDMYISDVSQDLPSAGADFTKSLQGGAPGEPPGGGSRGASKKASRACMQATQTGAFGMCPLCLQPQAYRSLNPLRRGGLGGTLGVQNPPSKVMLMWFLLGPAAWPGGIPYEVLNPLNCNLNTAP